jgi:AcrR family transcriptional regulator
MAAQAIASAPPRRLSSEQRRAQLLEVAKSAFARSGYRGTTALEIGREAGVSEKLVLKHFGSKENLFRAAVLDPLLELLAAENERARANIAAGHEDSPEQGFAHIHDFLTTWAALVRESAPLLFVFLAELRDFPDVAQQLAELFERRVNESTELLALAASHPAFRPFDPKVAFLSALGAATVAALAADDPDSFIDEYIRLTLFGALSDEGRAATEPVLKTNKGKRSMPPARRIGNTGGPKTVVSVRKQGVTT